MPALRSNASEYPRAAPHMGSNAMRKLVLWITPRSTISPKRFRYAGLASSDSLTGPLWRLVVERLACCPWLSPAAISASIFFVTSGRAGQPSGVENLIPLYSGGLCDAVKLITPSALHNPPEYNGIKL